MVSLRTFAKAAFLFASTANAHFLLLTPPSLEGDSIEENKEGNAPCGAKVPDLSQTTTSTFHVDGDSVAVQLGHPQAKWLIRGTLVDKAAGNWTQLFPIVLQSGLGNFCEPAVTAPKSWVNKTGIISVVANAPDGTLYQCAIVNFVEGANTSPGSSCSNGSAVTGDFTSDATLSALVGDSSTSTTPSPKPSGSAASSMTLTGGLPFGGLLATAAMVVVGMALL